MYRLLKVGVLRLADNTVILPDRSAQPWLDYLRWLSAGNVPLPMEGN